MPTLKLTKGSFLFLFSERLKMDNTVTQDDDDGGKIQLVTKFFITLLHESFATL